MPFKKILLIIFFFFTSVNAFADVFVVTSNADSGPGTLRDALTQAAANGSAVKDYINFNITDQSIAGRTITLISQLPDVSSNLVIDGSTQPGTSFGISDAKVALFYQTPFTQNLSGLRIVNRQDVEIYGLYIKYLTDTSPAMTILFWKGIEIKNAKNVQIGDAGKGNVIMGFYYPLVVNYPDNTFAHFEGLLLKDNFLGIDIDGKTLSKNNSQETTLYDVIGQITIGGASPSDGNLCPSGITINQDNYGNYTQTDSISVYISSPATITIQNNKVGVDYNVQNAIPSSRGIMIGTVDPGGKNTCYIEDNIIVAQQGFGDAIFISNNGAPISILRNYIGTDKTLQKVFTTGGIFVYGATEVQIGNNDPANANFITNCAPVRVWPFSNVAVNKNSFFCTKNAYPMHLIAWDEFPFPDVAILNVTSTSISGTATPNSAIELFYSDYCGTCSPQTYFASTTADNAGIWQYNGPISGAVIASATLNKNTSEFTRTTINTDSLKIINACVSNGLGSIKGIVPKSAANIKWIDINRNVVGTLPDLLNVPLGKYKLLAQNGGCSDSTNYFEIKPKYQLTTSNLKTVNPSCSNATGSITGLTAINNDSKPLSFSWTDGSAKEWSKTLDVTALPVGNYTLTITSADKTCSSTYGPITLTNTTGPNIDQSNANITPSNCGSSSGSITNVKATGTGTLTYIWKNSQQQTVSTASTLSNQPAGNYTLQVTDQSGCGPITSAAIAIPEANGIAIDTTVKMQTPALCGQTTGGSITNIRVTGATSYQWFDGNGNTVSTQVDLTNVAAGRYYLVASNAFCSKQTMVFTVAQQANTINYGGLTKVLKNATCGLNNGSIKVIFTNNPPLLPAKYRWVNSSGQTVGGNSATLTGIDAGTYQFYASDANGCEKYLISYSIGRDPALTVTTNNVQLTDDHCQTGAGSIKGIDYAGKTPVNCTWTDVSGNVISNTIDLNGVKAGTYNIKITDGSGCEQDLSYTINNTDTAVPLPSVSNVQLCTPGAALIAVNNPSPSYGFKLYDNATNAAPITQNVSGKFNVVISANHSYFISQYIGTCESSRAEVMVSLGLSKLSIANTFTPNNDGINDTWKITGMENYPDGTVQIYNRTGQLVFESKGYISPFDGRMKGQDLPLGTYYYIINLNTKCDVISGSITLVR